MVARKSMTIGRLPSVKDGGSSVENKEKNWRGKRWRRVVLSAAESLSVI